MRVLPAVLGVWLAGCGGKQPEPAATPAKREPAPETYRVSLDTSQGEIVIEVTKAWAPRAASRFWDLVNERYFDGARFHRVLKGSIAQFGYNPDPKVSQFWSRMQMPDDPPGQSNRRGTLSFATSGPLSRTTHVFINLANNARLDKDGFVPFGKVASGMETADRLLWYYGDGPPRSGPDPVRILREGNAYLEREFRRLDSIKTARVVK